MLSSHTQQSESPESIETMLGIIQQKEPERWIARFFNNFQHELPGGYVRDAQDMDQLTQERHASNFKKTLSCGEFYSHIDQALEKYHVDVGRVRQLFDMIRQSPKSKHPEIQAEIDATKKLIASMRAMGLSDKEISEIYIIPPSEEEHQERVAELWKILGPVYTDLRALGYSHYDLTGIMPNQV